MSKSWSQGSTRAWRKVRLGVLDRDEWTCRLCGLPINPELRPPHPKSSSVHHTLDRGIVGDDPRYLVASHRDCNAQAGEPGRHDPEPKPMTRW